MFVCVYCPNKTIKHGPFYGHNLIYKQCAAGILKTSHFYILKIMKSTGIECTMELLKSLLCSCCAYTVFVNNTNTYSISTFHTIIQCRVPLNTIVYVSYNLWYYFKDYLTSIMKHFTYGRLFCCWIFN